MKFRITFKDANVDVSHVHGTSPQAEENKAVWDKFVEYDEYIMIEFDSRTGKARVVPVRR